MGFMGRGKKKNHKKKTFHSCLVTARNSYLCCGPHGMNQIHLKLVGVFQPLPDNVGMGPKAHSCGISKHFEQVEYYGKSFSRLRRTNSNCNKGVSYFPHPNTHTQEKERETHMTQKWESGKVLGPLCSVSWRTPVNRNTYL